MHRPATQQMQVHVIYRLAAFLTGVHHRTKTLGESFFFRDLLRHRVQMSDQPLVTRRQVREGRDVFARDQQHMHRRLRMNIGEHHRIIILVELLHRNLTRGNLAEQAIHADQLTPTYLEKNRGCPPGFHGS